MGPVSSLGSFRGEEGGRRGGEREVELEEPRPTLLDFRMEKEGQEPARSQQCGWPPDPGKGKEMDSPPELPETNAALSAP